MPMFRPLRLTVLGLFVALLFALGVSAVATPVARAQSVMTPSDWFVANGDDVQVHFYFFWSESCPHCREAHPSSTRCRTSIRGSSSTATR